MGDSLKRRRNNRDRHYAASYVTNSYAYAMQKIVDHALTQGDVKVFTPEEIAEYQKRISR